MTIKKILQDDVSDRLKSDVLGLNGYEYKLHRLSNATNSETVLLIVKKNA